MDTDASFRSKRSFAQVASATLSSLHHRSRCNNGVSVLASAFYDCRDSERVSPFKRRSTRKPSSIMPIQTTPPLHPDSFPSFMSVFGGIPPGLPEKDENPATLQPLRVPSSHGASNTSSRRPLPFQHRESVSSMTSASSDSSPTTTISTFDSPSAPDISPSSSPESPSSMPLSYPKFMPSVPNESQSQPQPAALNQSQSQSPAQSQPQQQSSPSNTLNPMHPDSPGRRARNLKNLSLRVPPPLDPRPPIATASVMETSSQNHLSAPASPVIPPKSNRRKPANLTIRTPGFDKSFSSNISEVVPPTPTTKQSLRHTESSPSLHSVFSPSFGPKGGMQLPRPMTHHGARRSSEGCFSPLRAVADENSHAGGMLHDLQEEDDHLDSRESSHRNERGYPNGPIRIYDSGVYLYLEPTAQEASQFDVVVNVAKEVASPFSKKSSDNDTVMSALRNTSTYLQPSQTSTESFKSAREYLQSGGFTPTIGQSRSGPEYVHVAWDHNSEILDDLLPLCELIDSRVENGKRVLVHCQLGASRSASLVIAYGLYKNRDMDFNSTYEFVKDRSRWVGPNMSLIYQLTDFRSRLVRGTLSKPAEESSIGGGTPKSSELPSAVSPSERTADRADAKSPPGPPQAKPLSLPSNEQTVLKPINPGFSKTLSHKRSLPPRPLPLRQQYHTAEPAERPQRPRTSYVRPTASVRDKPEELPSIFSPRTTEFMAAPMAAPIARPIASLTGDGPSGLGFDPRSPPPGNERLIMRSIDELL